MYKTVILLKNLSINNSTKETKSISREGSNQSHMQGHRSYKVFKSFLVLSKSIPDKKLGYELIIKV